jgi:hypothetical protein
VTQLTVLWFVYGEYIRLKNLVVNLRSHDDHVHTTSLWQ